MSTPEQAVSELDRRVSDTVDFFGHPCLVLAEHVAQAARDLRNTVWRPIEDHGGQWDTSFRLRHWNPESYTERFIDTVDCPEVGLPVAMTELGRPSDYNKVKTPVTGIQLVAPLHVREFVGKQLLRKPQRLSILELDRERPMWLTARARHIAYPILHISQRPTHEENMDLQPLDAPRAPCAFVSEASSMLGEVGEPVLYDDDIKDPKRKEQLSMFYQMLKNKLREIQAHEKTDRSSRLKYEDMKEMGEWWLNDEELAQTGAAEKFEQIFGPVNDETERVISAVKGMAGTRDSIRSVRSTTVQQGVKYPARLTLAVSTIPDGLLATTTLELTAASGMGPMPLIPPLRVYPHSREPLRFDDVKDEEAPRMRGLFVELLDKLQPSSAPGE